MAGQNLDVKQVQFPIGFLHNADKTADAVCIRDRSNIFFAIKTLIYSLWNNKRDSADSPTLAQLGECQKLSEVIFFKKKPATQGGGREMHVNLQIPSKVNH